MRLWVDRKNLRNKFRLHHQGKTKTRGRMEKHCTDSLTKKPVFHNIADLYLTTSLNFKWEKKSTVQEQETVGKQKKKHNWLISKLHVYNPRTKLDVWIVCTKFEYKLKFNLVYISFSDQKATTLMNIKNDGTRFFSIKWFSVHTF